MCPRLDKRWLFWVSGLTYHKCSSSLFQCPGSWVLGSTFQFSDLWVVAPTYELGHSSWVLGPIFRVSCLGSHPQDGSRVSSLGFHQKSQVSGTTFWICPFLHIKVDYIFVAAVAPFCLISFILIFKNRLCRVSNFSTCSFSWCDNRYLHRVSESIYNLMIFCNILFFCSYSERDFLGLLTDGGRGSQNRPLPKFCHTYPTVIKLGTVISYLKKIQKTYKSCDTPNKFCSH